jgi:hypothetical protein
LVDRLVFPNQRGCSTFCDIIQHEHRAAAAHGFHCEPGTFTNRSDPKAKNLASVCVKVPVRIMAGGDQKTAQPEHWRMAERRQAQSMRFLGPAQLGADRSCVGGATALALASVVP